LRVDAFFFFFFTEIYVAAAPFFKKIDLNLDHVVLNLATKFSTTAVDLVEQLLINCVHSGSSTFYHILVRSLLNLVLNLVLLVNLKNCDTRLEYKSI
jgi:hypothetical protein